MATLLPGTLDRHYCVVQAWTSVDAAEKFVQGLPTITALDARALGPKGAHHGMLVVHPRP